MNENLNLRFTRGRGVGLRDFDRRVPWVAFGPFCAGLNMRRWRLGLGVIPWTASLYVGPIIFAFGLNTIQTPSPAWTTTWTTANAVTSGGSDVTFTDTTSGEPTA